MTKQAPHADAAHFPPRDTTAYSHWCEDRVRYADLDAVGHANNNAIGVYFESARVELLRNIGVMQVGGAVICVVARLAVDYIHEMQMFEQVRIGQRIARIGNSSVTLQSAIFVKRDGVEVCTAVAEAVCVLVDGVTHRPTPIPPDVRKVLENYA